MSSAEVTPSSAIHFHFYKRLDAGTLTAREPKIFAPARIPSRGPVRLDDGRKVRDVHLCKVNRHLALSEGDGKLV